MLIAITILGTIAACALALELGAPRARAVPLRIAEDTKPARRR